VYVRETVATKISLRSDERRWMLFQKVSQQNPSHRARNGLERAMFGDRFASKLLGKRSLSSS
jgi:hypothetical protein